MIANRTADYLVGLVNGLRKWSKETEWIEFKYNRAVPEEIGEYISALANSAALTGRTNAFMVWGVDDATHEIIGTDFDPTFVKKGGEELENWLLRLMTPKIDFRFHPMTIEGKPLVLLEIGAAFRQPVRFMNQEFIRVGSYKKSEGISGEGACAMVSLRRDTLRACPRCGERERGKGPLSSRLPVVLRLAGDSPSGWPRGDSRSPRSGRADLPV